MSDAQHITIPGSSGILEAIVGPPTESNRKLLGIICHPHPLFEGTMNNKVVTTLARAFQRADIVPLRFNFRGVGKSEGKHGYTVGEIDDLKSVVAWANIQYSNYKLILAGFSFGAYIAARVAVDLKPVALITVAPAVHHQDYASLPRIDFPWLLIQGEADEVVPSEQVLGWATGLEAPPEIIRMQGVSHFFHGQLLPLRDEVEKFLNTV